MASCKVAVLVPPALAANRRTAKLPAWVGVPEIRPVAMLTASPSGRALVPKLVGALEALIW